MYESNNTQCNEGETITSKQEKTSSNTLSKLRYSHLKAMVNIRHKLVPYFADTYIILHT